MLVDGVDAAAEPPRTARAGSYRSTAASVTAPQRVECACALRQRIVAADCDRPVYCRIAFTAFGVSGRARDEFVRLLRSSSADDAGDDAGGHACAAQSQKRLAEDRGDPAGVGRLTGCSSCCAFDTSFEPGRDDIWLLKTVLPGRTARAVPRYHIVAADV